jgi:Aminoacyl-tRNA editing domain
MTPTHRRMTSPPGRGGTGPWRGAADVVKTLVVRCGEDDFLFVLVPGDRVVSWPKLRALLGVSRLSLPDAEVGASPLNSYVALKLAGISI